MTYVQPVAPRRPGSEEFKLWPSRFAGDHREAYSPPVGPCAGMAPHGGSAGAQPSKSNLSDAEKKRLRSLTWRGGK